MFRKTLLVAALLGVPMMAFATVTHTVAAAHAVRSSQAPAAAQTAPHQHAAALVPTSPLAVSILGPPLQVFDASSLAALPRQTVRAGEHDEATSDWSGVSLADLVHKAGAPTGKALRGKAMALVVRVLARDGYVVVFSLAELDADFGKRLVLVADRDDGKPIGVDGPLRLVVPGDLHAARWLRNIERIEVVSAAP